MCQVGLDLKEAYEDLRHVSWKIFYVNVSHFLPQITSHPHPYNSHANDDVRAYILSGLETFALNYPHIHISNELISNGSWASPLYGVYFKGTNILVKIVLRSSRYTMTKSNNVILSFLSFLSLFYLSGSFIMDTYIYPSIAETHLSPLYID
jgi:hypothetical protein